MTTRITLAILGLVLGAALSSCDTLYGVQRYARVLTVPNMSALKARIETYPEVDEVEIWDREGGRSLTVRGIMPPDEEHCLSYRGGESVQGYLYFSRDYEGEVSYWQGVVELDRKPPQARIDATWPVMKKIESDLIALFAMPELAGNVRVDVLGVEDPERTEP